VGRSVDHDREHQKRSYFQQPIQEKVANDNCESPIVEALEQRVILVVWPVEDDH
jgi:hypothetical protein